MLTRRSWLAAAAASAPAVRPSSADALSVRALAWSHLPAAAQRLAADLGLAEAGWEQWRAGQQNAIERRIADGSAEHVTYYTLQAREFTGAHPLVPVLLSQDPTFAMPEAAERRARDLAASFPKPLGARHRLIASIAPASIENAYRHTMSFLRAKEIDRAPVDGLYHRRGLSSDTAPANVTVLEAIPGRPRRILLAGPGLDFTRREKFDDALPLVSHQLEYLRRQFPDARVDMADVRPEVIAHLGARRADITTSYLEGGYDLAVATNLLLYFDDRELLTALAGLACSLAPGGMLLHNDTRFAAKVFGEALAMPVRQFAARTVGARGRVEQWDRAVIHQRLS